MEIESALAFINLALTWIGFGTVVGLVLSAVMGNSQEQGTLGTVLTAIVGALLSCIFLQLFSHETFVTPTTTTGFIFGVVGATVGSLIFSVLGAQMIQNSQRYRRRQRQRGTRISDDLV